MTAGQAAIEELVNALVHETLESDHDGDLTADQLRSLMKRHYTVGGLVDVLSVFGPVNDDVILFILMTFSNRMLFSSLPWVKLPRTVLFLSFAI